MNKIVNCVFYGLSHLACWMEGKEFVWWCCISCRPRAPKVKHALTDSPLFLLLIFHFACPALTHSRDYNIFKDVVIYCCSCIEYVCSVWLLIAIFSRIGLPAYSLFLLKHKACDHLVLPSAYDKIICTSNLNFIMNLYFVNLATQTHIQLRAKKNCQILA